MLKVAVQAIEIAIGVSVALLLGNTFFNILFNTPFLDLLKGDGLLGKLSLLLGTTNTMYVYILIIGAILILICRWFVSWLSTDGHTSPNR